MTVRAGTGIVGYITAEPHGGGQVGWTSQAWDIHDAFELGIKVGDEWWFEGDIGEEKGRTFILKYYDMDWLLVFDSVNIGGTSIDRLTRCKRIGTIHDREGE